MRTPSRKEKVFSELLASIPVETGCPKHCPLWRFVLVAVVGIVLAYDPRLVAVTAALLKAFS